VLETMSGSYLKGSNCEGGARRRSERVVLRSLATLSAVLPGGKRICIDVHTIVVNAHGGLLEVGMDMAKGQPIRLSDSPTGRTVTGRVLRIEHSDDGRFAIAFELESPAPHFWPISRPPLDWSLAPFAA
jgi:hypothetical protein